MEVQLENEYDTAHVYGYPPFGHARCTVRPTDKPAHNETILDYTRKTYFYGHAR